MKLQLFLIFGFFSFILKKNDPPVPIYFEEYNKLENVNPQLKRYIQEIKSDSVLEIFHIGDSHIQIGEFSKGFLTGLRENEIQVENGWYLPHLIFQDLHLKEDFLRKFSGSFSSENIIQQNKTLNIGLTGRTFRFNDIKTIFKFKFKEKADVLAFFHSRSSVVSFESNKSCFIESKEVSENTAITQIYFKKPSHKFKICIQNPEKNLLEFYAIRNNFQKKGIHYSNFSVSGAKFENFELAPLFYEQLATLKAKILVITLGTNDSYYRELNKNLFSSELTSFIKKIKLISPETELIFMNAPDTYYENKNPPNLDFVNSEIERISKEQNCAFWNWNKITGGKGSVNKWKEQGLVENDLLHFSSKGYLLLGKLFSEAILDNK